MIVLRLALLLAAAVEAGRNLPCNCIEGDVPDLCLYRRRYCALSYWYGKAGGDGKPWLAGESGCADGCTKISVPGVDGGPDICLTPLPRKDLKPASRDPFGRGEGIVASLADFAGAVCDGRGAEG